MARQRVDYLTDQQEPIVRCVRQWITERGVAPTVREVGERLGMRSIASAHYQLVQCERKGAIIRERGRPRGIRLV
jgi:repressor LexA